MNKLRVAWFLIVAVVASGCATKGDTNRLNAFHDVQPASILVVPPMNEVTDVQATTSVLATLPYFLGEKGFYVFPVNTVKTLLEFEGYYEPSEVHAAPPEQLAKLFKADAVLYVTIHEWTSKYIVFATSTEVDFGYKLVSADGELMWEERLESQYSPNSNSGGGVIGLVVNTVSAAMERAAPNYIPLTRNVHGMALIGPIEAMKEIDSLTYAMFKKSEAEEDFGIPPGPYHPDYAAYYERVAPGTGTAEKSE